MNDRELLALAAKAGGIELTGRTFGGLYETVGQENRWWNPLTDDGDALRLAVRLGIAPIQYKDDNVCAAYWTDINCCHVGYKSDPEAATRRAIVRAAAEIGRGME